jgi:hypothetical protein
MDERYRGSREACRYGVIQLRQTTLPPEAQTFLATWLVLSAVMRDQKATAHAQKIQPAVRHLLMSEGVPPAEPFVGIGAFNGPRSVADSYNARVARSTAPPHQGPTCSDARPRRRRSDLPEFCMKVGKGRGI